MIPLETVFLGLVIFFGVIGALRGWAKELLVTFSVILARFVELVLTSYMPVISGVLQALAENQSKTWFYVRALIFIVIIVFGYATTVISAALSKRARKEKLQDTLLGFFLGSINGYLIVGIIWGFLIKIDYQMWGIVSPEDAAAMGLQDAADLVGLIEYLPLTWLDGSLLFVAVALSFMFVLIVFV
jgi:uncharacterized membrane protein required for colicin V production